MYVQGCHGQESINWVITLWTCPPWFSGTLCPLSVSFLNVRWKHPNGLFSLSCFARARRCELDSQNINNLVINDNLGEAVPSQEVLTGVQLWYPLMVPLCLIELWGNKSAIMRYHKHTHKMSVYRYLLTQKNFFSMGMLCKPWCLKMSTRAQLRPFVLNFNFLLTVVHSKLRKHGFPHKMDPIFQGKSTQIAW